MGRRLNGTVPIHNEDGTVTWYGPGDTIPAAVADQIGEHAWVDDDDVVVEADGDGEGGGNGGTRDAGDPPPRGGQGSGTEAWADYAEANGVQVEEDASRDDIIAACEAAGIRTE